MSRDKRRQYGTGSIHFNETRQRWIGTIEAGWTARGTRRRVTVTGKTEAIVKDKLKKKTRDLATEGVSTSSRATVKAWADQWLDLQADKNRPTTMQATASQVRTWIIPTIGHRRLEQLTPGDVRAVTRAMAANDLYPSTQRRAHATLQRMLKDATLEGHNVPRVVTLVEGPDAGESDRDAILLPDALAILEAATRRPDASRWVAALLQGMRPAECLGLTWSMVDFDDATIDVSWQLKPLAYRVPRDRDSGFRIPSGYIAKRLDGALHLVRPKTSAGRRLIPLVPWMAAALTTWRDVAPASPHGLVWPRADGRPQTDAADREQWFRIQDEARVAHLDDTTGRRYALYEARHSTATLLRAGGADEETITAIMGHSSILSTKAYLHSDTRRTRAAMESVAEALQLRAL
ncbi:site-specific integrase [Ruania suaedae]|uniref:tyrosine-type recombinase/integrase n=1 Tax=Ruania suaedae TaxID=2897774 RepID=UPI001E492B4F|nr:tyrosine-type recombinase/integrase [Ruania suaedae]UFU03479.1 site-specific integrase [Ruania suaedae]